MELQSKWLFLCRHILGILNAVFCPTKDGTPMSEAWIRPSRSQITELGGNESGADDRKWSCLTVVISLQKVVRAFLFLPRKSRVSSQVRFLPGGLFSLLFSFELYGMLSISHA